MLPASAVLLVVAVAMLTSLTLRSVDLPVREFYPQPAELIPAQSSSPLRVTKLAQGQLLGPESIAVRRNGVLYAGTADGHIVEISVNSSGSSGSNNGDTAAQREKVRIVATVGGRPLGLHFNPNDDRILYVAEAVKGLMAVNIVNGEVEILTSQSDDARAISYANDLDVSKDGKSIFLSDSTTVRPIRESDNTWSTMKAAKLDIVAAQRSGRLLEYNVEKRVTISIIEGLAFANGVALSEKEDFVLVCESTKYRVTRLWLDGRAPQVETFIDRLPGHPDGISRAADGGFWVSIVSPRNALLDLLHPWPWVKWLGMQLPWAAQPEPAKYGLVLHYDVSGKLTHSLHDVDGTQVPGITSVTENDHKLYLGGLTRDFIAVHDLQQAAS